MWNIWSCLSLVGVVRLGSVISSHLLQKTKFSSNITAEEECLEWRQCHTISLSQCWGFTFTFFLKDETGKSQPHVYLGPKISTIATYFSTLNRHGWVWVWKMGSRNVYHPSVTVWWPISSTYPQPPSQLISGHLKNITFLRPLPAIQATLCLAVTIESWPPVALFES